MFGVDVLSSVPITHLLMAEMKTFNATSFDIEPMAGNEGKYNDAKWYSSTDSYWVQYEGLTGRTNSGKTSASDLIYWLSNVLGKSKGQGITFSELSPADAGNDTTSTGGDGTGGGGTAKDCSTENREAVAGDTTTCGSCLSGYVEDETGACVAIIKTSGTAEIESSEGISSNSIIAALAVFGMIGSFMVWKSKSA